MAGEPKSKEVDQSQLLIGQRILSGRLRKGWNQIELAERAAVSRTTLYQLERGEIASPRAGTLHRIAQALGLPVSLLQAAELPQSFAPPVDERDVDRQTNPFVDVVREEYPQIFAGFTPADWDELYSSFGTGGALTEEGVLAAAQVIAGKREILRRVSVLLETHLAEPTRAMVDSLFALIEVNAGSAVEPIENDISAD